MENAVRRHGVVLVLAAAFLSISGDAWAQRVALDSIHVGDPGAVYRLELRDGSTLLGTILAITAESVRIEMEYGTLDVPRTDIVEVRKANGHQAPGGAVWPQNSAGTHLLIGPTALPLEKGEATFSDIYLFFLSGQVALTNRVSIGAGLSVFPVEDFTDNLFYITPKVTVVDTKPVKLAAGALVGYLGGLREDSFDDSEASLGFLYGVATHGSRENNLSLGMGWGYQGGQIVDQPLVMVGGQARVSRRLALVTENWFAQDHGDTQAVISYGFRILGERLAADVAFFNATDNEVYFPGIPFVGISMKH